MSWMFTDSFFNEDISEWDTSNVIDMTHMFDCNKNFNHKILNGNTSNVKYMSYMFYGS